MEDFVKEALIGSADVGAEEGKLDSLDFTELAAFLSNQWCLEDFIKSCILSKKACSFVVESSSSWLQDGGWFR